MSIPIGSEGRVLNSSHPGMRIRVEEDPQSTSGYLIHKWWQGSTGPGPRYSFEDRVENRRLLEEYFAGTGWIVDWTPTGDGPKS